jgi:hypothetical protein
MKNRVKALVLGRLARVLRIFNTSLIRRIGVRHEIVVQCQGHGAALQSLLDHLEIRVPVAAQEYRHRTLTAHAARCSHAVVPVDDASHIAIVVDEDVLKIMLDVQDSVDFALEYHLVSILPNVLDAVIRHLDDIARDRTSLWLTYSMKTA